MYSSSPSHGQGLQGTVLDECGVDQRARRGGAFVAAANEDLGDPFVFSCKDWDETRGGTWPQGEQGRNRGRIKTGLEAMREICVRATVV